MIDLGLTSIPRDKDFGFGLMELSDISALHDEILVGRDTTKSLCTMDRTSAAFAALKTLYYRSTVILSRGRKSGHNQSSKNHGCKKRSNAKTRIHLDTGPMADRRYMPSFSTGARLD